MNIIMDSARKFGILWEENSECNGFIYGKIQIIIGENIYPKICPYGYFTLNTVFNSLKSSFEEKYYAGGNNGLDFGEQLFDIDKYNSLELCNIFSIDTTYMSGGSNCEIDCLVLEIGYSGEEERLFYSFDNGKNFKEIRYKKGTVESVIFQLNL
ncbi:hypothetical protein [Neisseria polysaccharea]|uniref:hypothetical protein n=1 Tax=Neisseria polysaccharea TaxID=489 RepID=UPI0018C3C513